MILRAEMGFDCIGRVPVYQSEDVRIAGCVISRVVAMIVGSAVQDDSRRVLGYDVGNGLGGIQFPRIGRRVAGDEGKITAP